MISELGAKECTGHIFDPHLHGRTDLGEGMTFHHMGAPLQEPAPGVLTISADRVYSTNTQDIVLRMDCGDCAYTLLDCADEFWDRVHQVSFSVRVSRQSLPGVEKLARLERLLVSDGF